MTDFIALTTDDLGADKILTTGTMNALYTNATYAAEKGLGEVASTSTYNGTLSSNTAGTWSKPAGTYDDNDTVLVELWGSGGTGAAARAANSAASGGEGGSYLAYAMKWVDCPASFTYSAGMIVPGVVRTGSDGATAGSDGVQSSANISGFDWIANGGQGGTATALIGLVSTTPSPGRSFEGVGITFNAWDGGNGGDATGGGAANGGDDSVFGGAGGGGAANGGGANTGPGGESLHGGNGSAGVSSAGGTSSAGSAPAGGSGGAVAATGTLTSGNGGCGRVVVRVLRGWHPSILSRI